MGKIASRIKNKISDNCSHKLPKCFTPTTLQLIKQCIQNRIGLRRYQMEKMVETVTTGGVGADSSCSFDTKAAGSYTYKYDGNKHDQYLYLAFEALCFTCGCFTWSDIGIY